MMNLIYRSSVAFESSTKANELYTDFGKSAMLNKPSTEKFFDCNKSPALNLLKTTNTKSSYSTESSINQSMIYPSLTRTFASFKQKKAFFTCFKGLTWNRYKPKFISILNTGRKTVNYLHDLSIKILLIWIIHIIRQIVLIFTSIFSVRTISDSVINLDKVSIHIVNIILILSYIVTQNINFFQLRRLKDATWKNIGESSQAIFVFYIFISISFQVQLLALVTYTFKDNSHKSYVLISIIVFQLLFDGSIWKLLIPGATFVFFLILIFFIFIVSVGNFLDYTLRRKCKKITEELIFAKKIHNIDKVLKKVAWQYPDKSEDNFICGICLETLRGTTVVKLDCDEMHIFHKQCMKEWLLKNNQCPICRLNIMNEELHSPK